MRKITAQDLEEQFILSQMALCKKKKLKCKQREGAADKARFSTFHFNLPKINKERHEKQNAHSDDAKYFLQMFFNIMQKTFSETMNKMQKTATT